MFQVIKTLAGMPGQGHGLQLDQHVPPRLRSCGNSRDIFAMVKANMSDDKLSQPPLLVYANSFLSSTERFFNTVNDSNMVLLQSLDDTRAEELIELATAIETDYPHMIRGARYLRLLTDPNRQRQPYSRLRFIEAGPRAALGVGNVQLGQLPPPPKPYKLQVVFHHHER